MTDPLIQAYLALVIKTYNQIPFYRQTTTIKGVGLDVVDLQCIQWTPPIIVDTVGNKVDNGCSVRSYLASAYRVIQEWEVQDGS